MFIYFKNNESIWRRSEIQLIKRLVIQAYILYNIYIFQFHFFLFVSGWIRAYRSLFWPALWMKKDAPLHSALRKEQKHGKGKENVEHRLKVGSPSTPLRSLVQAWLQEFGWKTKERREIARLNQRARIRSSIKASNVQSARKKSCLIQG